MRDARDGAVPHLSPEEFRRLGHRMVDWIADYQARLESFPVPGQVGMDLWEQLP